MAVGFGQDKLMGDDAVVLATDSNVTSRWNIGTTGAVHDSVETGDIGVMNEMVQVRVRGHFSGLYLATSRIVFSEVYCTINC